MGINLVRIVATVAAIYACYAAFAFLVQRALIYPGRSLRAPAASPGGVTPLWLETPAGRVEAWFLAAREVNGPRPAVLVFHGNGELIDFLPEEMAAFRDLGLHVLLVEYPGYGRSGGKPTEAGVAATAVAAYDLLTRRSDVDPGRLIGYGRSLGCAAVCLLSRQRPLAAMVLQAPFTSLRPFARQMLLPSLLLRDVYDNAAALREYAGPVLIMHGRHDDVIPFAHGEDLARQARDARLVPLDCAHNDCPSNQREFWCLIGSFLQERGICHIELKEEGP